VWKTPGRGGLSISGAEAGLGFKKEAQARNAGGGLGAATGQRGVGVDDIAAGKVLAGASISVNRAVLSSNSKGTAPAAESVAGRQLQ
jgi:hypothetical protein